MTKKRCVFWYNKFPLFGQVSYLKTELVLEGKSDDYIIKRIDESENFYEETILSIFGLAMMGKEGCVIDAGANIGNHTIFTSKILNRETISIEPSKKNLKYLKQNIKENDIEEKVCVEGVAVSDKRRRFEAKKYRGNAGKTQLIESDGGRIESVTIDEIVGKKEICKESIAGIKLDLEGMEREAIQGAKNTIRKYKPAIVIEDKDHLVSDVLEEFAECKYKVRKPLPQSPTFLLYTNNFVDFCKPFLSMWNRFRKLI